MSSVPIQAQIECVEREIKMRERVYPGWVAKGNMTPVKAKKEIEAMQAVLETLRMVERTQRLL